MMKLSKTSWHYKYTYNIFTNEMRWLKKPTDFCAYVRQFIKVTLFYLLLLHMAGGLVFGTYLYIGYGGDWSSFEIFPELYWAVSLALLPFMFFSFIMPPVVVIIAFVLAMAGVCIYIEDHRPKRDETEKEPGMIKQAYTAWKEKYCPLIEVVDE